MLFVLVGLLCESILTSKLSAVAPEVMSSEVYGEAADIWGLGCIALEMLSLNFLWEVKGLLSIKVLTTPVAAGEMSSKFSAQVRCMLSKDLKTIDSILHRNACI